MAAKAAAALCPEQAEQLQEFLVPDELLFG